MTQENKELLVKCCIYNFGEDTVRIKEDVLWSVQGDNILTLKSCIERGEAYMYHQIKPYLFLLSSMTEEQEKEYYNLCIEEGREEIEFGEWVTRVYYHDTIESIDWLNAHNFD